MSSILDYINAFGNNLQSTAKNLVSNTVSNLNNAGNSAQYWAQHPAQIPAALGNEFNKENQYAATPQAKQDSNNLAMRLGTSVGLADLPSGGITAGAPLPPVQADLTSEAVGGPAGPAININGANSSTQANPQAWTAQGESSFRGPGETIAGPGNTPQDGPLFPDKNIVEPTPPSDLPPTQENSAQLKPTTELPKSSMGQKLAQKVNQVGSYQLPSGVNNAAKEAQDQAVLNQTVPGGTLGAKYANIGPTLSKVSQEIESRLPDTPANIPASELKTEAMKNLQPLIDAGTITPEAASQEVNGWATRMYNSALQKKGLAPVGNTIDASGNVVLPPQQSLPDTIPDSTVYQMKASANQAAKSIYNPDGSVKPNLSVTDQVNHALRDATDTVFDKYRGDIADLNQIQSSLYRISDPRAGNLGALRNQTAGIGVKIPGINSVVGIPSSVAQTFIRRPVSALLNGDPLAVTSTIGALGFGAKELAKTGIPQQIFKSMEDKIGYMPKTDKGITDKKDPNINDKKVPNNADTKSIAPGVNAHMTNDNIKNTTGIPITTDEYNQDIMSPSYAPGSNARVNLDAQYALAKQIADQNMPGNIPLFMGGASNALAKVGSLQKEDINSLSQVYSKLKNIQDYQAYTSDPSNPFATQLQKLSTVNDYFKQAYGDVTGSKPDNNYIINPGDSPEQIKEKLAYQTNWINDSYKKYQPYWDAKNPTAASATTSQDVGNQTQNTAPTYQQNTTSLPETPPAFPPGFKMTQ